MRFLDTNIFLRHFTQDHPIHSPKATALLRRVEEGREVVVTSALIIFEIVFTLERQYRVTKGGCGRSRAAVYSAAQPPG